MSVRCRARTAKPGCTRDVQSWKASKVTFDPTTCGLLASAHLASASGRPVQAYSFLMPRRFLRGSYLSLSLTVVALACGVAMVCAIDLANAAVLRAFVEVVDAMSGRATLLNLLAGLDRPSAGRVVVAGRDLARLTVDALSDLRLRQIGFVFQSFNLFPSFTVE